MTQHSTIPHLKGQKLGMTRVFDEKGVSIPVTVIRVEAHTVTQVKTPDRDGYSAVQLGTGDIKSRNSTMPLIAHDAKAGVAPRRHHHETRLAEGGEDAYELGQTIDASVFEGVKYVDVIGTSKGKGFAGGMKRWGFKGQLASHGVERKHRSPGSIGGHANNAGQSGRIKKGKKMAGQLGNKRITVRSLDVIKTDPENSLVLVKGPVPGANKGWVEIRPSVRLYKTKGKA